MKRTRARIYRSTARNLGFLARRLVAGELVAVPTETVYGLAANARDGTACARIFWAKRRPKTDPLIVHIHAAGQLAEVCAPNESALRLASQFWPGPLTLILPKRESIPDIVTAGKKSVGVRMPSHPVFRRLLARTGIPLAAPSANPFGGVSPTTAQHVRDGLGARIHYILDGGPSGIGLESTILDLRDPQRPRLLRPGAVTRAELERALGRPIVTPASAVPRSSRAQLAPGQLARHYSPRTPVVLHDRISRVGGPREAFVFLRRPRGPSKPNVFWLDAKGRLRGVARRLFATLRRVDALKFSRIHVELARGDGLAHAINDRLRRAAAR